MGIWLDYETDKNQIMLKIQTLFVNACREFLIEREFIEIHSPKLIGVVLVDQKAFEVEDFNSKIFGNGKVLNFINKWQLHQGLEEF